MQCCTPPKQPYSPKVMKQKTTPLPKPRLATYLCPIKYKKKICCCSSKPTKSSKTNTSNISKTHEKKPTPHATLQSKHTPKNDSKKSITTHKNSSQKSHSSSKNNHRYDCEAINSTRKIISKHTLFAVFRHSYPQSDFTKSPLLKFAFLANFSSALSKPEPYCAACFFRQAISLGTPSASAIFLNTTLRSPSTIFSSPERPIAVTITFSSKNVTLALTCKPAPSEQSLAKSTLARLSKPFQHSALTSLAITWR